MKVLIIGAGPSGLAAHVSLGTRGITADLVDRYGVAGGAYSRMYPRILLSSPRPYLELPGFPLKGRGEYLEVGEYAEYLAEYATRHSIEIIPDTVTGLVQEGSFIGVKSLRERLPFRRYQNVVVATGMSDSPIIPSEFALKNSENEQLETVHSREWNGVGQFSGSRILIVGAGMRAVEIAEECCHADCEVYVSCRSTPPRTLRRTFLGVDVRFITFPILEHIPLWIVQRWCQRGWKYRGVDNGFTALLKAGHIKVLPEVVACREKVVFFVNGVTLRPDLVVLATGYRFEMPFIPSEIPRGLQGYPLVRGGKLPQFPGVFFVGIPCAFRADSHFVHGAREDANTVSELIAVQLQRDLA